MITDTEFESIEKAKSILGEHFGNYVIGVVTDSKELYYDYLDPVTGRGIAHAIVSAVDRDNEFDLEEYQ